ncbi:ABC transporter permease [Acidipila sp. EB88]|uniref:ABC transporter permease n=1 Tax=Acidipila sp. EB88 TaxID=2305226 RepID=UPI000F5FE2AF|nr:FtsX-like permease family protein [Acidipila sp. EB88]RRA47149.1 ABC transporter permease [Acidipila sp. EB88]
MALTPEWIPDLSDAPPSPRPLPAQSIASSGTKPALPWRTALRIAARELLFARVKFVFVILSVAIGVGALTGVRGFADSFSTTLLGQARSILAADLSARMSRALRPDEATRLAHFADRTGAQMTQVTEMASMAGVVGDPVPLLVSLKVVDPAVYPFYGTLKLQPSLPFAQAIGDHSVVVDESLLVRLHTQVGAMLRIGGQPFKITALIAKEPDRLTAGVGIGPRVMMTRHAVEAIGLLQPGSRSTERFLFKLPLQSSIQKDRQYLEHALPEAQVADFREGSPELTEGLDEARGLLSLICLVAMVLGAIGVAMAMRAHLQQRIDGIAIMKSMGARSADILRIYILQTLLLGCAGALLGVVFGVAVEWVLPSVLGSLLPIRPPLRLPWLPVLGAFATGILTTMLFALPPLLEVRDIRPSVVLRRLVEAPEEGQRVRSFFRRLRGAWVQLVACSVIVLALAAIAALLSDSWKGGGWFAGSLAASLLILLLLASTLLRVLRAALDRTRLALPSILRHGLANLYRPGNQSAAVLAALGVGVMLILSVFLMQRSIVERMHTAMASNTPNVFLIDIASNELEGVRQLVTSQTGAEKNFEALPILTGSLDSLEGTPVQKLDRKQYPMRLRRTLSFTWSDQPPAGITVEQGTWWASNDAHSVAVIDRVAKRMHLHVGSQVGFSSDGQHFNSTVSAIYKVDGQHISSRSEFIFAPAQLSGMPVVWYAAVHMQPKSIGELQRVLFAHYPTVTAINIADILDTIQQVVGQITIVIRFLAGFSILSGMVILASSIASTRFRRVREVVVLKTLGATRARIAGVFSVEFLVLGLLSGCSGAIFANGLSRVLLHLADVPFISDPVAEISGVLLTAVLAILTGWLASWRILGQKPLEVLREE